MKFAVAAGLLVVALSSTASAQPRGEELSEEVALGLSLGGTLVSWGLLIGSATTDGSDAAATVGIVGGIGTMFAPGAGHIYAGDLISRGFGIRAAGVLAAGAGIGVVLASCPMFEENESDSCDVGGAIASVLLIGGVALYVTGTVDDIITAPRNVRRHNQSLQSVGVAPMLTTTSAGFALGGRF